MTNLIASILVALVTNTTERFPTFNYPSSPPTTYDANGVPQPFMYAVASFETRPVPNPKSKDVITECKEVTTLRFEWNGAREVVSEKLLWRTVQSYKLDNQWKPVGGPQPAMPLEVKNFTNSVIQILSKEAWQFIP